MTDPHPLDAAIFGGGIAGLWLLDRLRRQGYRAALFESARLGEGQTRHAQGIIHGGTKYALTGKVSDASRMVAGMPARWRSCLAGEGDVDLRAARLLSDHQYLWSTRDIASRLAGFFASRMMRSRMAPLPAADYPALFRDPAFRGQVYRLDEPVLDVASLLAALAEPHREVLARIDPEALELEAGGPCRIRLPDRTLTARRLVFTAGGGNRALLAKLGREEPPMQLRPLQMVALRGADLPPLYAHCLGASSKPRLTITSHRDASGRPVWYLGGQLAEEGVGRSPGEQIATARAELETLFPWHDFGACAWITLPIDRAEVRAGGTLPDDAFVAEQGGVITVWPTKLALAPVAADRVLDHLAAAGIQPQPGGDAGPVDALAGLPRPEIAPLPWQEEERWN